MEAELDAVGVALNIWRSVLEILNGRVVQSCIYGPRDEELFKLFFRWQELDLKRFVGATHLTFVGGDALTLGLGTSTSASIRVKLNWVKKLDAPYNGAPKIKRMLTFR